MSAAAGLRAQAHATGSRGVFALNSPKSIPLPQLLRLLCASKRVERIGGDAGAVFGPGVMASKKLFVGGERGFAEGECIGGEADEKQ